MRILVVGQGGREHALCYAIAKSKKVKEIFVSPGNPGMDEIARRVDINAENIAGLADFALNKNIDITVVGPETPLALGISDEFNKRGLNVIGPVKEGALLESSKVFAKNLMRKYSVPTAFYEVFDDYRKALEFIEVQKFPVVIKAEGLAQGKGVVIARDKREAREALEDIMVKKVFGSSGERVVIEEFLEGREVTVLAFCDGNSIIPMLPSRDHKRLFDNNEGPNTGGMGAICPCPDVDGNLMEDIYKKILIRTLEGLKKEGIIYKGILYAGLMLTKEGPKVLEFNCRFGDPEAQAVLPLLKSDVVEIFESIINENLDKQTIEWEGLFAVNVVAASGGYPGKYEKGKKIIGLEKARQKGVFVFHSGTLKSGNEYYTSGGRVLSVTAMGAKLSEAREKAYDALKEIYFEGMHFRKDIGLY
ncbi:phosphoribosylamine--glycine ligase [Thermovenabulum gondwanense]|uniref:Phosphoribosylamine--glycine ligase n=1 Tax=Thermovenabulum gondwanense TaxID=520767 RepID=A0A162MJJ3_9FIRM|nr:phosphoribosylamine--glycine ligase [Thermovenabulum gondwanense]KYO66370.1 Phosphoribosylamine--glycine ligase [Thermovenabulum gondwanense]